nr:hypothetical protein [Candidatus Sigynarchaeota archaeon]
MDGNPPSPVEGTNALAGNKAGERDQLWRTLGVHRPLASFWFNYVIFLVIAIPALLMYTWILPNYILPFPDAMGFQMLTVNYFGLFFSIMDVATGPACERFASQYAEINPRKALRYIQFFVYFQMFTGLLQVTIVAIFCLFYLVNTNLNYAMWFFMIYSTVQFPGMLGAFNSSLKGFQRYDRANVVDIVQGVLFENITSISFILVGRYFGSINPILGEMMGATIGFIIGKYIDDFFALALAGHYLSKILKPYGIKLREVMIPGFTRVEARECLVYGFKLVGATLISALTDYLTLIMMITWMPNYVFIMGLIDLARTIANLVNLRYDYSAILSESYNNGKKKLAQYAVTHYLQNWMYLASFLTVQIAIMIPPVFSHLGGNFAATASIIPLYVIPRLLVTPAVIGAEFLQAFDRPEYRTYGIITEKVVKMVTVFLFLSPWGLTALPVLGETALLPLYVVHDIPAYIAITAVEFYLVHKKCVRIKINVWQMFGATAISLLAVIPVNLVMVQIFNATWAAYPSIVAVVPLIALFLFAMLFFLPMLMFFVYGLVGGFDSRGIQHFANAVVLCGPSKFIVNIFCKCAAAGFNRSPLKDRFKTPWEEADKEASELMALISANSTKEKYQKKTG